MKACERTTLLRNDGDIERQKRLPYVCCIHISSRCREVFLSFFLLSLCRRVVLLYVYVPAPVLLTRPSIFLKFSSADTLSSVGAGFLVQIYKPLMTSQLHLQTCIMVSSDYAILRTFSSVIQKLWPSKVYQACSKQIKSGKAMKEAWCMLGCVC